MGARELGLLCEIILGLLFGDTVRNYVNLPRAPTSPHVDGKLKDVLLLGLRRCRWWNWQQGGDYPKDSIVVHEREARLRSVVGASELGLVV